MLGTRCFLSFYSIFYIISLNKRHVHIFFSIAPPLPQLMQAAGEKVLVFQHVYSLALLIRKVAKLNIC